MQHVGGQIFFKVHLSKFYHRYYILFLIKQTLLTIISEMKFKKNNNYEKLSHIGRQMSYDCFLVSGALLPSKSSGK